MIIPVKSYLIDGPLMLAIERKKAVTERMARDMTAAGAPLTSDRDAVRFLMKEGYHYLDVALLAGAARMLAYQEIVAREMSEP